MLHSYAPANHRGWRDGKMPTGPGTTYMRSAPNANCKRPTADGRRSGGGRVARRTTTRRRDEPGRRRDEPRRTRSTRSASPAPSAGARARATRERTDRRSDGRTSRRTDGGRTDEPTDRRQTPVRTCAQARRREVGSSTPDSFGVPGSHAECSARHLRPFSPSRQQVECHCAADG